MHTHKPANSTFHGPIRNLRSLLCFLIEILSRVHAKAGGGGCLMITSLAFIGRFPNDGAAIMAVKGLRAAAATIYI